MKAHKKNLKELKKKTVRKSFKTIGILKIQADEGQNFIYP